MGGIVREFSDPRISYIRHDKNRGLPEALNTGFAKASGSYLTWTSDDNYFADDAIEQMLRFMQSYPEVDFIYADNYIIDEDDRVRVVQFNRAPESLAEDNYIGACFLYKRAVSEKVGRYNPKAFLAEDYEYWVRISKRFCMQRLFRVLYYYRTHSASLTAQYAREEILAKVAEVKQAAKMDAVSSQL
jgi:GT2 family glycosyltransferase